MAGTCVPLIRTSLHDRDETAENVYEISSGFASEPMRIPSRKRTPSRRCHAMSRVTLYCTHRSSDKLSYQWELQWYVTRDIA